MRSWNGVDALNVPGKGAANGAQLQAKLEAAKGQGGDDSYLTPTATSTTNYVRMGGERARKPLAGAFDPAAANGDVKEEEDVSPRKKKSRLRMVDEFGNALNPSSPEISAEADKDQVEISDDEETLNKPADEGEVRGLRKISREVRRTAREAKSDG